MRERRDDIMPLCDFCLNALVSAKRKRIVGFTKLARDALLNYSWPGNVRELENVLQRAVIICSKERIDESDLSLEPRVSSSHLTQMTTLKEVETEHIMSVLKMENGNRARAAKVLGISRSTLWAKMKEAGLEVTED